MIKQSFTREPRQSEVRALSPCLQKEVEQWDRAAAGSARPRGALGSLKHLFFGVQICPQQLTQGASRRLQRWEWGQCPNVTRQPCCHPPAAQRASCAHSPVGPTASSLWQPQEPEPGPPSQGFWTELRLPASRTSICTNTQAGGLPRLAAEGPPRLSVTQARFPWKAGGGPANPISSPLGIICRSAPFSTDTICPKAAQGTPKQDRQAPRAPGCPGAGLALPLPALLISRHGNQVASSVLQELLNPPQPLHQ